VAIALVLGAKGAGVAVTHWLVEAFKTPSGSMIPTLLVGDRLYVKKARGEAARGDAIVFELPMDRGTDYIKRVVAIGGDSVQITNGIVSINGVALVQTPAEGACSAERPGDGPISCRFARETDGGHTYTIMFEEGAGVSDHPRTVVPDGHVFVLGDNRDNSYDSRKWGAVPLDHIKGRASVIWWSREPGSGIHWSRIGSAIP
jgi:signal peptidase I